MIIQSNTAYRLPAVPVSSVLPIATLIPRLDRRKQVAVEQNFLFSVQSLQMFADTSNELGQAQSRRIDADQMLAQIDRPNMPFLGLHAAVTALIGPVVNRSGVEPIKDKDDLVALLAAMLEGV